MDTVETIYLNIAGFNIQINLQPTEWDFAKKLKEKEIKKYWAGFIISQPKKINYKINFVEKRYIDIIYKKKKKRQYMSFFEEKNKKAINTFYRVSIFQFQTILRHIINKLLAGHGFILHGSASNINGRAFLFTGRNGAGKSTIMKLLKDKFPPLADDTIFIKKEDGKYYLYQTPFIEKEWWVKKNSQKLELRKVYFLKKERFFKEELIKNKSFLFEKIAKQSWVEEDKFVNKKTKLIYQFAHSFNKFYYLSFTKNKKRLFNFIDKIKHEI